MTFAQILSEMLERYGISQTQLAAKSGVHRTTINQYLNCDDWPRPDVRVNIALGLTKITGKPFAFFLLCFLKNLEEK